MVLDAIGRTNSITFAAVLSLISGALGLILCATAVLLFFEGTLYTTPGLSDIISGLTGYVIPFGLFAVILSLFHIGAGYLLWLSRKPGGVLAIALSLTDATVYLFLCAVAVSSILTALPLLLIGLFLLSSTVSGWYRLH
jgi:hypothetical protein